MRAGVTMTTTLLAKDTSHRTVFPVFTAGGGLGLTEMEGAGDFVMVADPATFRVLPWAHNTGWMLCDIYLPERQAGAVLDARSSIAMRWRKLAKAGFDYCAGLEVEFHLFKLDDPEACAGRSRPGRPSRRRSSTPRTASSISPRARFDQVEPIMDVLRKTMQALGMPLRSLEVELGPSQYEFTFAPERGLRRRRHHGAVPQRHEAGGAAARPSGQLHVPAAIAQRVLQRLASASVAARPQDRKPTLFVSNDKSEIAFAARPRTFSPG